MPCHSVIYSGRYDGAYFVTRSPWTKCYINIHTDLDNPFTTKFDLSITYQPGYELIWLHNIDKSHNPVIHVYKPSRPYESITTN